MSRELLAEILAQPDDDAPRRVYADALGDDPRGELVHVQCELARMNPADPRREALARREQELLAEHGPQWIAELGLPPKLVTAELDNRPIEASRGSLVMFRRGFPTQMKVHGEHAVNVELARLPLRRLVITNAIANQLERLPSVPTLHALKLRNCVLSQEALDPITATVVELVLEKCVFDLPELAACPLPNLRELEIAGGQLSTAAPLVTASWLPALQTFRVVNMRSLELAPLLVAKTWRDLRQLSLIRNYSTTLEELISIATAPLANQLRFLEIDNSYRALTAAFVDAYADTPELQHLERFELRGYVYGPALIQLERRFGARFVTGP